MKIRKQMFIISLLVMTACGTAKVATSPTTSAKTPATPASDFSQADVERGAKRFSGLTMNDLTAGKALYEAKCSTCHKLKRPGSRSETEWKEIVPDMAKKADKKANSLVVTGPVIDAASQELILKYLITMGPLNSSN